MLATDMRPSARSATGQVVVGPNGYRVFLLGLLVALFWPSALAALVLGVVTGRLWLAVGAVPFLFCMTQMARGWVAWATLLVTVDAQGLHLSDGRPVVRGGTQYHPRSGWRGPQHIPWSEVQYVEGFTWYERRTKGPG